MFHLRDFIIPFFQMSSNLLVNIGQAASWRLVLGQDPCADKMGINHFLGPHQGVGNCALPQNLGFAIFVASKLWI